MDWIQSIEIVIIFWLQSAGAWLRAPANFFTFLGTENFYLLVMPALYWCVDAGLGLRIGLILTVSGSVNAMLKLAFHTPRPYWVDPHVQAWSTEASFGLPSGHAQNAAAIWGLAGLKTGRRGVAWACLGIIFLIGLSRLVLGVHYMTDVLAGWAVGGVILYLFVRIEKPVLAWGERQSTRRLLAYCLASSLLIVSLVLGVNFALGKWPIPITWEAQALAAGKEIIDPRNMDGAFTSGGIWLGLTAGVVWLNRRFGGFKPQGGLAPRALSYLIGLAGVLVFWYALGTVFPRGDDTVSYLLRFARYTLVGLWVSVGAPWLFKRLGLVK